jgi:hypothetical protein
MEPCGAPNPAQQSWTSGRKRVLRGVRVQGMGTDLYDRTFKEVSRKIVDQISI